MDPKSIDRIAHLARLKINPAQREPFAQSLTRILHFISQLGDVDTENVSPLVNVSLHTMALRSDTVTQGNQVAEILQNAPQSDQGMFVVPRVV